VVVVAWTVVDVNRDDVAGGSVVATVVEFTVVVVVGGTVVVVVVGDTQPVGATTVDEYGSVQPSAKTK
jgi:FlaG/FlaF family flagellin (archaellin)